MKNPSFKKLEEISPSRYEIAMMTAKRAKQLIDGESPLVKSKAHKPVTIALTEIMEGKVLREENPTEEVEE